MTQDEARVQLERMVAHDSAPELTPDEIDQLLNFCQVSDAGWALDAGAAEGWRWKAGKVVADYSFAIDSQLSDQGQVYDHCITQVGFYESKAGGLAILRLVPPYAISDPVEPDPQ